MAETSIGHMPEGRWAFDIGVANVFEDMLERSIPQYETMRDAVSRPGVAYMRANTRVVDLGCSEGGALASLSASVPAGERIEFIGYEMSEPMVERAEERFAEVDNVDIVRTDLRNALWNDPVILDGRIECSVILSVLTLMFIPVEYRASVIEDCYRLLSSGGALIVVEKVLGRTGEIDQTFKQQYNQLKQRNGYSSEEIERKRLSLEGVLVPMQEEWNVQMLREVGFSVDCFWRWMNFGGWLAVKP